MSFFLGRKTAPVKEPSVNFLFLCANQIQYFLVQAADDCDDQSPRDEKPAEVASYQEKLAVLSTGLPLFFQSQACLEIDRAFRLCAPGSAVR